MISTRQPRHCIVPPYMLQSIAENGSPAQQEKARANILASEAFRGQRTAETSAARPRPEALSEEMRRVVYNAGHTSTLPGELARNEGDPPTGDAAVDEAYEGAGATYELYSEAYGRNSIDDQGMRIMSTVHYRRGYDNAFWDGRQMVYGDGDEDLPEAERLFNRFTKAVDVIGHELTHGVTQFEAGLVYQNEPGALNESISDVFGILVAQHASGQLARESDWIVGADLLTDNVNGLGLRSMRSPGTAYDDPVLGKDPQPAHMRDFKRVSYDNGGVHINSGIPNRAFYVAAWEMDGFAWEKAGHIWYVALRDKLRTNSNFLGAARQTIAAAGELFGDGSQEQRAVRLGWSEVGVDVDDDAGDGDSNAHGCLAQPIRAVRQLLGRL